MNLYFRLVWMIVTSWRQPRGSLFDGATTRFRVWPTDIDAVGHMNNAKYLGLMDLGRVDLMLRSRLFFQTRQRGWYAVVSAQTIRYRRSLKPFKRFVLHTTVLGTDERAVYFEQSFLVGGELYAHAVVQARFLQNAGGDVPPGDVLKVAGGDPGNLTLPDWVADWAVGVRQAS